VRLASGEVIEAAAVVFNGDAAALSSGLLGAAASSATPAANPDRRSLSAITWNMLAPTSGFPLLRHNVFFSGDSKNEFDALFSRGKLPADPTVYVCAQDRGDDESYGDGFAQGKAERLLCLVNAPARGDALTNEEIARCEEAAFARLRRCGLQADPFSATVIRTTPADFNRMFPATGGALYGQASHGWQASFARPGSRSKQDGLYLTGGSVHPGPGVPMAALSGSQAAASVLADLGNSK
jgi:1-hydroxycarotenoid 3,4-desaturase